MTTISSMKTTFDPPRLLPLEDALQRYFATVTIAQPPAEEIPLDVAFGRVLARGVVATAPYPSRPRSSMDGFAIRAASTPATLRIVGEVEIGIAPTRALDAFEAIRIPTGGILPDGADAIVPIEAVSLEGDVVRVTSVVPAGDCVIASGADMREGETILEAGRRIGSPELAVLATLGIVNVPVYRRPVVAVFSSGDELISPEWRPHDGQVRDSNPYAISGTLVAIGAQPRRYPIVPDRAGALETALASALDECDAAIVSGGSSVGDRDFTRHAIDALGWPGTVVHGLRIRPGRPALLGAVGRKPVIGLPGNPASALFVLEAVAVPILALLTGGSVRSQTVDVTLAEDVRGREGWTWFVPLAMREALAYPLGIDSFATSLAARASGYLRVGGERVAYEAGERVPMQRFLSGGSR
jgi:molybdenum cofactor synthesis domain-containing protein